MLVVVVLLVPVLVEVAVALEPTATPKGTWKLDGVHIY